MDGTSPVTSFQKMFENFLSDHSLLIDPRTNQHRVFYSLRHTAMTLRLLYGKSIDLITLARNARTSVDMIERFYSSNLTAEMNIDLLQGKRN